MNDTFNKISNAIVDLIAEDNLYTENLYNELEQYKTINANAIDIINVTIKNRTELWNSLIDSSSDGMARCVSMELSDLELILQELTKK